MQQRQKPDRAPRSAEGVKGAPEPGDAGNEFEPHEWPFFWLTHATSLYLTHLERGLKKSGLDISRWRVLMCLAPGQARSVSEIAELAIVKLPTMMKLIQRMDSEGLVSCEARVGDGRVTDVLLTALGLDARQRAWEAAKGVFRRVFGQTDELSPEGLNVQLRALVQKLSDI